MPSYALRRTLVTFAAASMIGLSGFSGAGVASADPSSVASLALSQEDNGCGSYYNCAHPGAWCADFARWVWGRGDAQVAGLGPSAYSFYTYGKQRNTIHSTPQVGDAVVYAFDSTWATSWANHVNLVVAVNGDNITTVGGNESNSVQKTTFNWKTNTNPIRAGRIRAFVGAVYNTPTPPPLNSNPAALPAGTLVKTANSATVKVIVGGAGIPITGDDVTRDGYDLSQIVQVTESSFHALPASPADGTVIRDESGTSSSVFVLAAGGTAMPLTWEEFTTHGYDARPLMGVPTSFLQGAERRAVPEGTLVKKPGNATVKILSGGAGIPLTMSDVSALGVDLGRTHEVPSSYFDGLRGAPVNGTLVKEPGNSTVKVMVGGAAAALTLDDVNALGYDLNQVRTIAPSYYAGLGTRPADGTLMLTAGNSTVWLATSGAKHGLTGAEWTAGGYRDADIVKVPASFLAQLPTV